MPLFTQSVLEDTVFMPADEMFEINHIVLCTII